MTRDRITDQSVRKWLGFFYTLMVAQREIPKGRLAEEAGVSRPTLYQILKEGPSTYEQSDAVEDAITRLAPHPGPCATDYWFHEVHYRRLMQPGVSA